MQQEGHFGPHLPLTIDLYIDILIGCKNIEVELSATEHHILIDGFFKNLASSEYCVCSDTSLIHIIGCDDDDKLQPVRRAIHRLRKKFEKTCGHCCHIRYVETLQGYCMTDYVDCVIIFPPHPGSLSSL
jgi:DNA-binding response OmpR family regulator